jgi:ABC-type branched-subunit amino acid transport system ATPase component
MSKPRLLLLDEPSFGLAPLVVAHIFEILRAINRDEKVAILLVEQNAALALELAERAYLLETGRIVIEGASATMRGERDRSPVLPGVTDPMETFPRAGVCRSRHRAASTRASPSRWS